MYIKKNNTVSATNLANVFAVTKRTIIRDLQELQAQGKLRRIGPNKGGHREVIQ